MINEIRLIKKIKRSGNIKDTKDLIERYYDEIYIYVYKQTSNKDAAMDITQEIFISMLKSIERFDNKKSRFRTWLYKIATYKTIDYFRSYERYKTHTSYINNENFEFYNEEDFIKRLEDKEIAKKILLYVNGVDVDIQMIFRLKIFAEKTFSEIANELSLSESTVKSKYYRLIRRLSKEFNDEY
ncbi:MAG: RNA polymerase sigma factor [Clostridia bacterium]|nr:RNA polymerase sigma factor [Clostridia bacterium]